jgi:hypothetical protein
MESMIQVAYMANRTWVNVTLLYWLAGVLVFMSCGQSWCPALRVVSSPRYLDNKVHRDTSSRVGAGTSMSRSSTIKDFNLVGRPRDQGLLFSIWLSMSLPIIYIDHVGTEPGLISLQPWFHGSKVPTQRCLQVLSFPEVRELPGSLRNTDIKLIELH